MTPHVTFRYFEKGEDAIVALQERLETGAVSPHGIVMDGNLKSDDKEKFKKGARVVTMIRSLTGIGAKRPFIIAHSSVLKDNQAMIEAGADVILQKPAPITSIQEAIEQVEKYREITPCPPNPASAGTARHRSPSNPMILGFTRPYRTVRSGG